MLLTRNLFFRNHRISFSSSVATVQQHITKIVKPIAKKYNLTLSSFDPLTNGTTFNGNGYIQLSIFEGALEPAPHTPTSGAVWDLFAGSARHALKDEKHDNVPYVISPFASTGRSRLCIGTVFAV